MKFLEKRFKSEQGEKIKVFLFGNTFLLLFSFFIVIFYKVTKAYKWVLCPMKLAFNSFCPFCGGSRCAVSFFTLKFKDSFMYHPTTMVLIVYAIFVEIVYIIDIIFKKDYSKKIFNILYVVIVYLVATMIQYFIRLYFFYNNIECPIMFTDL